MGLEEKKEEEEEEGEKMKNKFINHRGKDV